MLTYLAIAFVSLLGMELMQDAGADIRPSGIVARVMRFCATTIEMVFFAVFVFAGVLFLGAAAGVLL